MEIVDWGCFWWGFLQESIEECTNQGSRREEFTTKSTKGTKKTKPLTGHTENSEKETPKGRSRPLLAGGPDKGLSGQMKSTWCQE